MKTIYNAADVPKTEHWAIITFGTIHIPGDERSRTHPGHGYPAYDQPTATYEVFKDKVQWTAAVLELEHDWLNSSHRNEKNWVAMKVTPAEVRTTVSVSVEER